MTMNTHRDKDYSDARTKDDENIHNNNANEKANHDNLNALRAVRHRACFLKVCGIVVYP